MINKALSFKISNKETNENDLESHYTNSTYNTITIYNNVNYKINNNEKEMKQNIFEMNNVNNIYNSIPVYKKRNFLSFLSFGNKLDVLFFIFGILFSFLQGITMISFELGLGRILDSLRILQSDNGDTTNLNNSVLFLFYSGIAVFVFSFIGYFFLGLAGKRMTKKMKVIYFKQILEKDSNYLDTIQISNLTSQFIDNVDSFSKGMSEKLNLLFLFLGLILGGIGVGFYVGWLLTLMALGISPFLIIGIKLFLRYLEKSNKLTKESYIDAASISEEVFGLIKNVKAFGGEEHEIKRFSNSLTKHEKISKKYTVIIGLLYGFFFFLILIQYSLGILIGTIVIDNNIINDNSGKPYTAGEILTIFFSILEGVFALGQIGPSVTLFKKALDSFENIDSFLKKMPTIRIDSEAGISPKKWIGEIEFKNVSFSYPSKKDFKVLKNISFKIKKGESVAFVGESGSGKSTIIQLIERFYDPDEGEILIDGKNIKDYNIYKLRSLIGLVSQEPFLFGSNIRNNLKLGLFDDQKIDDSELENVLEKVNAFEFVNNLENGLDTYVGSGGSKLSGGQKQRISLARTILKNPQILLLDEATSSLDRKNEIEIQNTLHEISKNRTSITIAHRLKTIENSDMIYVLKDGELIENGNHKELLKWKKEYYKFQKIQNIKENVRSKDIKENNNFNISEYDKIKLESIKKKESENKKIKEKKIDIKNFLGNEKKLIIFGILGSILNGSILPIFGLLFSDILTFLIEFELIKTMDIGKTLQELENETYLLVMGMFLWALGTFLFNFASVTVFNYVGEIFTSRLRINYFKNLIYKDTEFFDNENNKPGSLNDQLQTDCKDINLLISTYIGVIIQGVSTILTGLIIAFIFSWRLTLVNLALLPLLFLGGAADNELQNTNVIEDRENSKQEGASILNETLNNIKIVWSLSSHKKFISIYSKTLKEDKNTKLKKSFFTALFFGFSQLSFFGIYALLFYLGGIFHQRYNEWVININRAIFSLIFAGYGAGMTSQFIANIGNANRAKKVIEEELNKKNKIEKNPLLLEHKIINNEEFKNKNLNFKGKIQFKNVFFKYPTRKEMILKNISFIIYPGEKIAFVGHSGCGKSTIIQILLRFYEIESGEIFFDDINIKNIDIYTLREYFGIVSQETTLFNGNVKYNIEYNKDYSENEIIESTKKALAYNFIINKNKENKEDIVKDNEKDINKNFIKIENLPEGFYFNVGNKGEKLSGGQRQRICISRCLIKNPIIYLFDEATSALDNQSEKEIQEAIDNIAKVNTSIIVAHRISTIKNSNKIFVIDNGFLVEKGTYDELINKNGIFHNLNN